jgi:hypothetical protein
MAQTYRFGRRIPLPSTLQIKHDLRVMMAQELAREAAELPAANENKLQHPAGEADWIGVTKPELAPS